VAPLEGKRITPQGQIMRKLRNFVTWRSIMLLRFGVENHGSIADYQEILFTASSLKDNDSALLVALDESDTSAGGKKPLKITPVVALYGANAAGKSTVLKAFDSFVSMIVQSHSGAASGVGTPYAPFKLDGESAKKPSRYDADIVIANTRYHYGYIVNGTVVLQEWLYSFDLAAARQVKTILFQRETTVEEDSDGKNLNIRVNVRFGKSLKGDNKQIGRFVRPNSLYLSVAAQNSHPQLAPIFNFFYQKVVRRLDQNVLVSSISDQVSAYFGDNADRQSMALKFLRAADTGITGMDFSKVPVSEKSRQLLQDFEQMLNKHLPGTENPLASFAEAHNVLSLQHAGVGAADYKLDLKEESAGTLSLLQLIGPAFARLNEGGVLVVDELNSTLHPLVSRELIRMFSTPEINVGKAQLLFSTHDTNLLCAELLRRDQVWFAEKDDRGGTHLYALSDIKIRSTDNFERGYLMGRFGAIPFIGGGLDAFYKEFENADQAVRV